MYGQMFERCILYRILSLDSISTSEEKEIMATKTVCQSTLRRFHDIVTYRFVNAEMRSNTSITTTLTKERQ